MVAIVVFLIKVYQNVTHVFPQKTCRYYPTCSSYAIEALNKYGLIKGLLKAIKRILKCSPLYKGGFDPLR